MMNLREVGFFIVALMCFGMDIHSDIQINSLGCIEKIAIENAPELEKILDQKFTLEESSIA